MPGLWAGFEPFFAGCGLVYLVGLLGGLFVWSGVPGVWACFIWLVCLLAIAVLVLVVAPFLCL